VIVHPILDLVPSHTQASVPLWPALSLVSSISSSLNHLGFTHCTSCATP